VVFFFVFTYKKSSLCDLFWKQLKYLRKKDHFEVGGTMKREKNLTASQILDYKP